MSVRGFISFVLLAIVLAVLPVAVLSAAGFPLADRVVVKKSERSLLLMRGDKVIKRAKISLGLVPEGRKQEEGDFRTPEGKYRLTRRNPDSDFFLSIAVSYPDRNDVAQASRRGVSPGGQIMIHGQPNKPRHGEQYYRMTDWTDGCIAVSNSDMVDIWLMTSSNTPIEILP